MSVSPRDCRRTSRAFILVPVSLFVVASLACPRARADGGSAPLGLAEGGGLVGLARGHRVSVFDQQGQLVAVLPPASVFASTAGGDARGLAAAAGSLGTALRARAALARERTLDELDVPEELRDSDEADDAAEDELPFPLRRAERAHSSLPAEAGLEPAWVAGDEHGLIAIAAGAIYRVRADQQPRRIGRAPGAIEAVAARAGRLYVVRAGELGESQDDGAHFRFLARLPRPRALVADPAGAFVAALAPGRLDLVGLGPGASHWVFRPATAVRAIAACAGGLAVLADDGLHVMTAAGAATRMAGLPQGGAFAGITCGPGPQPTILLYGPAGFVIFREGAFHSVAEPDFRGPSEVALIDAGTVLWTYHRQRGLLRLAPGEAPIWAGAALALPVRPRPRGGWRGLLPHLSLLGQTAQSRQVRGAVLSKRDVRLGLSAEWRLGGDQEVRPWLQAGLLEAAAVPAAPLGPAPAPPPSSPPDPYPAAALAAGPPLPPDPDLACLAVGRVRAVARALAEPERARSLVARAGQSAWLPELRLRAEKRVGRSESLDSKPTAAGDALGFDTDDAVRYEVRATWDLPRLVFNPEELGASAQSLRIADMRREIEAQVNRLYYERRRLLGAKDAAPGDAAVEIRLEELEADLDAVSGGAFARCLRRHPAEVP